MGSRHKARIIAFQALYGWDITHYSSDEILKLGWIDKPVSDDTMVFARLLIAGTLEKCEDIDQEIKQHLEHWDFNRLSKVDLAILRIGVYSLLYQSDIPWMVTIDEAIDLAKEYGSGDSYRFVNGVLDGIRQHHHELQ